MKIGTKVSFTRKNGESVRGKVINVVNAGKGDWLHVDVFGSNDKPTGKVTKIRPSQATKV